MTNDPDPEQLIQPTSAQASSLSITDSQTPFSVSPPDAPFNARIAIGLDHGIENRRGRLQTSLSQLDHLRKSTDSCYDSVLLNHGRRNRSFLQTWLGRYRSSTELRRQGLLVLRDIFCDNGLIDSYECLSAGLVLHSIQEIRCNNCIEDSALLAWRHLFSVVEQEVIGQLVEELFSSKTSVEQGGTQGQPSLSGLGGQFDSENPNLIPDQTSFINDTAMSPHGYSPMALETQWPIDPVLQGPPYTSPTIEFNDPELQSSLRYEFFDVSQPSLGPVHPFNFTIPVVPQSLWSQPIHQSTNPPIYSPTRRNQGLGTSIKESRPFQMFLRFLQEFNQSSHLLQLFSARRADPQSKDSYMPPTKSTSICRHTRFATFVDRSLLNPLSSSKQQFAKDPAVKGILSSAESMVSLGNLQCLRQVERYLTSLGKHLLPDTPDPPTFSTFATEVLYTCNKIAADPVSNGFCYVDPNDQGDWYSNEYLDDQFRKLSIDGSSSQVFGSSKDDRLTPNRTRRVSRQSTSYPSGSKKTSDFGDATSQTNSIAPSQITESSRHQCHDCPKSYSGVSAASSLSRHRRTIHHHVVHQCPYCFVTNNRTDNLNDHIRKSHKGKKTPSFGKRGRRKALTAEPEAPSEHSVQ
ncbi:hypothetical protein F4780DRAFT_727902 [Xylariomycetidae sp. FL0641]|nr:hypothetical protein F4780DRAFT_727902 [Xylariomycetidae sp. FL0641]